MREGKKETGIIEVDTIKVVGNHLHYAKDTLSVEEPLEIRVTADVGGERLTQPVSVTMRTPGNDGDLAAGFLFTEGIINLPGDIDDMDLSQCNIVEVTIKKGVAVNPKVFERHSFVASSCGVCGKKSIDAVRIRRNYLAEDNIPQLKSDVIHALPETLRKAQAEFDSTGGIHASGLFESSGKLLVIREDVGRHNALDKVIGFQLQQKALPLTDAILLVSGRASFELVQKAAHAGIGVLAAVGAPSSLAVELAEEANMTLIGFVRNNRFNIYSGAQRFVDLVDSPESGAVSESNDKFVINV
ncbi:MAG: formate dehydrogenase accessory sulfurtransferase FdhD [Candidatus Obscuribacterales bacterium]|nr:formate dehydrogenase accessory sulfurtransferase FdhD [Candidatus Obscuribacterales bacterium]